MKMENNKNELIMEPIVSPNRITSDKIMSLRYPIQTCCCWRNSLQNSV